MKRTIRPFATFVFLAVTAAHSRDNNLRNSLVRSHLNETTASVEDRSTFLGEILAPTPMLRLGSTLLGAYHHQFQVHLYKLQRGIRYQMLYLQQGLHWRDRKTPGRPTQRALTFNTTKQHRSSCRSTFFITRTRLY